MNIDDLFSIRNSLRSSLMEVEAVLLKELSLWQSKATNGFFVQAVIQYKKENNCSLPEAQKAVKAFLHS